MAFGIAPVSSFSYSASMIKRIFLFFVWMCFSLEIFGQGVLGIKPKVRSIQIDGYAARVNDRVITRSEVLTEMGRVIAQLQRSFHGAKFEEEFNRAFKQTCNDMVDRILILSAFKELGGRVPEEYVQNEVHHIIKTRFKGDAAQFEQSLALQKMTRSDYLDKLRDDIKVKMMMNEVVRRRARITPSEVRREYEKTKQKYFVPEKVKYSVILINKGKNPQEMKIKRKESEKIRKELLAGKDFAEVAKRVSEGARAAEGGKFPWMQPKDARLELQKALHTLDVGKISDLIETKNEFYILKIHGRRKANYQTFEKVREDIKKILERKEQERLKKRWIKRLRAKNYVIIF